NLPDSLPEIRRLPLQRLSHEGIARLSESMLGPVGHQPELVTLLARETEGNVFFLIEVMRALAQSAGGLDRISTMSKLVLPDGIGGFLAHRLARIPASARPLLQLAAILGRTLDLEVLRAAQPELDSWLTLCANAGILDVIDQQWQFA